MQRGGESDVSGDGAYRRRDVIGLGPERVGAGQRGAGGANEIRPRPRDQGSPGGSGARAGDGGHQTTAQHRQVQVSRVYSRLFRCHCC